MEGRVMGIYIKGFKPQDGLYVIKDRVIRKYKGKGGTVRPYDLVEVKEPRCYLDGFMRRRAMRIDEAILIMENERPHCGDKLTFTEEERYEAYTWAIGALKELSSAQFEERTEERTETHACDLIKRQDAIDSISADIMGGLNYESILKKLPSAERPTGEWIKDEFGITVCSECKRPRRDSRVDHINFCNSCGARMINTK